MTPVQTKFAALREGLSRTNLERYDEVEISLAAIVTGMHVAFIGPPGTGKSMLVRQICGAFTGARYFERLLTRFTTPEELFGPLNIPALEAGRYERVTTGYLPEAHIVFADEVFKANPAILNSMLGVMNERLFHNGAEPTRVPLVSMFGASNELPEAEELGALFDRFQFRRVVNYIVEPSNFITMLKLSESPDLPSLTLDDLADARMAVAEMEVLDSLYETLYTLRNELTMEGIIVSDRRFRQGIKALQALAWLEGASVVSDDHFRILQHMFWTAPQDQRKVARIILGNTNPLELAAEEIRDMVNKISEEVTAALLECRTKGVKPMTVLNRQGIEWYKRLKDLSKEIKKIELEAVRTGKNTNTIRQVHDRNKDVGAVVGTQIMGFSLDASTKE